jgi:hypothetical protein
MVYQKPHHTQPTTMLGKLLQNGGKIDDEETVVFSGLRPAAPRELHILECVERPRCSLGVLRGFLSHSEVSAVFETVVAPGVKEVKDRHETLEYNHKAYRLEGALRFWQPKLLRRLINSAWAVDGEIWKTIGDGYELQPEVEFIEYDAGSGKDSKGGFIDPHTDNDSLITVVVMLSDPNNGFRGGANFFEDGTKFGRRVDLKKGDAVVFRGMACEHWVTTVTAGRRHVLQIELSTGHECWCGLGIFWLCCVAVLVSSCLQVLGEHVHVSFAWCGIPLTLFVVSTSLGSRKRLPPRIRSSPWKQGGILLTMILMCALLSRVPSVIDHIYSKYV